ncbi:precorrin-2 dehydrogenase / sirohydrochlorin ferrochelatase [Marininema mesophilum]|uniref:precorrin-2 dehydrogenase n=1 Tax=Marininema mesophilum TaxID=1048340 RepID=A0A1H2XVP9_9BACL|nr:NAD(P)-dependent oxidoreductase [Marininema mesophilum]SDW96815.1 precorrin-2 dehydrogenase / sirohydrochlorin ferrochelatase [Marininema mesophilum]
MAHIPLMVNLRGRLATVIGGGKIAARRVRTLCEAGAQVTIVAPEITPTLMERVNQGVLHWHRKPFEPGDLDKAWVIVAATDNKATNRAVAEAAGSHCLVNVVDDSSLGNFHVPVSLNRGKLTFAVSTGGASPILARRIREDLARQYDETWGEKVEQLYQLRERLKKSEIREQDRHQRLVDGVEEMFKKE